MKRHKQRRRSEIIRALSDLSRGGWVGARREDYAPLERELREIDDYNRDLTLRIRDGQVGSGMKHR